ncbi:MAG: hypothetical protein EOP45_09490 [Sphingobacteriaceae bacterium]|nr:MAG: hypothetical protein EOP45_09490 [Sphingobacteriaceae bacterium]
MRRKANQHVFRNTDTSDERRKQLEAELLMSEEIQQTTKKKHNVRKSKMNTKSNAELTSK